MKGRERITTLAKLHAKTSAAQRRKVKVCKHQKLKVKQRAVTLLHVTTEQQTLVQHAESIQKV